MSAGAEMWALALAGIAFAAFVKGTVGFGFPLVATPLVALASDVRTAVAVLLLPNIVMDTIQVIRRPGLAAALRRHAALLVTGVVGTVVGTRFLSLVSLPVLLVLLGASLLVFIALSAVGPTWRLPPGAERPLAPVVGLVAGTLGGLTNTPGVAVTPYYYALGLPKGEFVRAVAATFLTLKVAQLGAVWQVGLLDPARFWGSVAATVVSLAAFRMGLLAQDRVPQATFNRAVLGLLTVLSVAMLVRGLRG
jgi:uncharacterized membrane protein YfcA